MNNTITLTINGATVTGTAAELLTLMSAMNGQTVQETPSLPKGVNYNTQGLESSIPTPSNPKRSNGKTKTDYVMVEDEIDGKKVYRIKTKIFWKPGNKKAGIKGKGDWAGRQIANKFIKALEGIQTGTFSWTDDNGNNHEYSGWYYTSKKKAQEALATLPFYITDEDRAVFAEGGF